MIRLSAVITQEIWSDKTDSGWSQQTRVEEVWDIAALQRQSNRCRWGGRPSASQQLLRDRGTGLGQDCCFFLCSSSYQWISQPWTQPTALQNPRMEMVRSWSWQSLGRPLGWYMCNPCCHPSPGSRAATAAGGTAFAYVFFSKCFSLSLSFVCVRSSLHSGLRSSSSVPVLEMAPVSPMSWEVLKSPSECFSALMLPRREAKKMLLLWRTHAK